MSHYNQRNLTSWTVLTVFTVQNALLQLSFAYNRNYPAPGEKYIPSVFVCAVELIKCVLWFLWAVSDWVAWRSASKSKPAPAGSFSAMTWSEIGSLTMKLSVPAGLYALQNNIVQFGYFRINSLSFSVLLQLKILTTALGARFLLQRPLNGKKWLALVLLTVGVILVQLPPESALKNSARHGLLSEFIGTLAMLGAAFTSGFAAIYMEALNKGLRIGFFTSAYNQQALKLKQKTPPSIAVQSLLLSAVCFVITGIVAWQDVSIMRGEAAAAGLGKNEINAFRGLLNHGVLMLTSMSAVAGLCVALVLRYADNLLKAFATAVSFILTAGGCALLMPQSQTLGWTCWTGTALVTAAILLYSI